MISPLCWQNWRIDLPGRWSPVKLEGDYSRGAALFADLLRPRLGMRWSLKPRKKTPEDWLTDLMRDEVGRLAALEAKKSHNEEWETSLLYIEPKPPGRDVWIGYSAASQRSLMLVHHARRRDRILENSLLPSLRELPANQPTPWSVFELSCIVDAGMKLASPQLNAGDLRLSFADGKKTCTVRQIAVAELALRRMPLRTWLAQQQRLRRRYYRPRGEVREIDVTLRGTLLPGLCGLSCRRKRLIWSRLAPQLTTLAVHDAGRDRLIFVEASQDELARKILADVGWARAEVLAAQED